MIDLWYCLDPVDPERMGWVSKRSEVVFLNGAPSRFVREILRMARQ